MKNNIKLTIGIATIPKRMLDESLFPRLLKKLQEQTKDRDDVEIIILGDNKKITVGKKRDRLVQMAQGKFVVLVDDDDDIVDDYIETVCDIIEKNKNIDVISYMQKAVINGEEWTVDFSLKYNQEPPLNQLEHIWQQQYKMENGSYVFDESGNHVIENVIIGRKLCERPPFPVCTFRTKLAQKCRFIDFQSAEDVCWAKKMWPLCKKEYKLDKIMHIYNWSADVSELPLMSPEGAKEVDE